MCVHVFGHLCDSGLHAVHLLQTPKHVPIPDFSPWKRHQALYLSCMSSSHRHAICRRDHKFFGTRANKPRTYFSIIPNMSMQHPNMSMQHTPTQSCLFAWTLPGRYLDGSPSLVLGELSSVPLLCASASCLCSVPLLYASTLCLCFVPLLFASALCLCSVPLLCASALCLCFVPLLCALKPHAQRTALCACPHKHLAFPTNTLRSGLRRICRQRNVHRTPKQSPVPGKVCCRGVSVVLAETDIHAPYMTRVGQNHIYTVYIRHFWQRNHQIYGRIRCIYTVLVNPIHDCMFGDFPAKNTV